MATLRVRPGRAMTSVRLDAAMIALSAATFALLLWLMVFHVHGVAREIAIFVDDLACVVFALEFLWSWQLARWDWRHPLVRWYDLVGMIPVASPMLRGLRLLRLVVLLAGRHRLGERIAGAALGARMTDVFVERLAQAIVAATAASVERNRDRMEAMLVESIHNDPGVRRLRHLPFHETIVRMVAESSYRIMIQAMADPRTDDLVAHLLRDNLDQVRVRVVTEPRIRHG
jgi:voltage-gated potassium channel